jgi:hypothetical protein
MECRRCNGRVFLDRTFSDNKNYELFCILCGDRRFVSKASELGQWLKKKEAERMLASSLVS